MIALKKIGLVLLILLMIYFSIGILACIGVIVIEATTHQPSIEIGENFQPWILYLCMGIFAIVLAGIGVACGVGYYYLRKSLRKQLASI